MDDKDYQEIKKLSTSTITNIQEILKYYDAAYIKSRELANATSNLTKNAYTTLPKVRMYQKRKKDLEAMLRSYGFGGQKLKEMIHKPDLNASYYHENGNRAWISNTCNYLIYSNNTEDNENLQVMLTHGEDNGTVLYISRGNGGRNSYYGVPSTVEEFNKLCLYQSTQALSNSANTIRRDIESSIYSLKDAISRMHRLQNISGIDKHHQELMEAFDKKFKPKPE